MPDEFGRTLASWKVPTFEKHTRSVVWHIGFGMVGIALLIYALISVNYLFILIIILTAFTVYIQEHTQPKSIAVMITNKGVRIGRSRYLYKDIKKFWIVYDPPIIKKLYFSFKNVLSSRLMVPLQNQNPLQIRELLLQFVEEDAEKEEESSSEVLSRLIKI